jgi:uncharacterized protein YndB with AHSA1/START domain
VATAPAVRARVRRLFRAQAEDVFDAWIDPAKIRQWFAPGMGETRQIDIEPRVGGRFCIVQRRADADATHTGTYLELERPRRLALHLEHAAAADQSRVHIEIGAVEDGASDADPRMEPRWAPHIDRIEHGWSTQLDAMASMLEHRADPMSAYRTVTPTRRPHADARSRSCPRRSPRGRQCHRDEAGSVMHAELQIGDSLVMLGQAGGRSSRGGGDLPVGRGRRTRPTIARRRRRHVGVGAHRQAVRPSRRRRRRSERRDVVDRVAAGPVR